MKPKCAQCGKEITGLAFQHPTRHWVAAGKFPTLDFCGPTCADKANREWMHQQPYAVPDNAAHRSRQ